MAIQNTPAHPHTSHAHGAHAAHHGASKAKPSLSADGDDGGGGGFAAMLRALPAAEKDAAEKPRAEARKSDDSSSRDEVESKDEKDKDEKKAQAKTEVDPSALTAWTAPAAPSTASLADKTGSDADPLGALRKAASKGKGADALAALGTAKDADKAKADPLALLGAGTPGKADITAALAKADEAVKAATEARDSLAALLPQPDPVAIQAGTVGAAPTAVQDPNQGLQQAQPTPPAQATLAMPPQAPTFAPALGHQLDVWMKGGVQHAEVQLSPQELGPIRVRIEMEGAQTRVHMAADVAATRDALQQAMPQLSEALGQVGISLSGGGVSDQPAFSQAQAQANADGGAGGGRQSGGRGNGGAGGSDDGLGGLAAAPRPIAQRRGLLDMYA
jgi:flagellar hook-length control protein FliK